MAPVNTLPKEATRIFGAFIRVNTFTSLLMKERMITMIFPLKIQGLQQKNGGYRWPMMRLPMRIPSDIGKCICYYGDGDVDGDGDDDCDNDDGDDVYDDDNEKFTKVNPE